VAELSVAVVLASGTGERFGHDLPKQFVKIAGRSILEHTLTVFERSQVDEVIIVVNAAFRSVVEDILLRSQFRKVTRILNGGATRRDSSRNAINAITGDDTKVLVHDAVRPFLSQRIIDECLSALDRYDAIDVAIPSADTIIDVGDDGVIASIPERKRMMRGQTPQAFRAGLLRQAHALAAQKTDVPFTDDCGMVVHFDLAKVHVVQGEERNLKITYPEDIFLADKLFQVNAIEPPDADVLPDLNGRVVVIFGASQGIGEAIAELAVAAGARVHGFSRSNGVDLRDQASVAKALEDVARVEQKIDYVVNTAAVLNIGKLETRTVDAIHDEIAINYLGAIHVLHASLPHLRQTRGSFLLFTSSSYTRGRGLYSVYSSTKAAIVNLAQACSEEVFADGIRINVINPERTATPMRVRSFGQEPADSLLSAQKVARASLQTLVADVTGQVVDVRR
jgi:2-C-methyl-D-erythritol 4-phosphate cytidylyltransferase